MKTLWRLTLRGLQLLALVLIPITAARAVLSVTINSPANNSNFASAPVSASFSASDNTSGRIIVSITATLDGSSVSFSSPGPQGLGTTSVTANASGTAIESPGVPGSPDYDVKLYNDPNQGNIIAVVDPTRSVAHYVDAVLYSLGAPVNASIAQAFLNSLSAGPPPPPNPLMPIDG